MRRPWFRLYSEFASDPVVQSLSFEDQRHFVVLMCLQCSGLIDRPIDKKLRGKMILEALGLTEKEGAALRKRLVRRQLCGSEWQVSAWKERQYISDSSTDRVRKYRKSKETGNVTETLQKRFCNGPEQNRTEIKKTSSNEEAKERSPETVSSGEQATSKATLIPPNFRPQSAGATLLAGLDPEEQDLVIREFVTYWTASGARRKSWELTWVRSPVVKGRVHQLKARKGNGEQAPARRKTSHEQRIEELERERQKIQAPRVVGGNATASAVATVGEDGKPLPQRLGLWKPD